MGPCNTPDIISCFDNLSTGARFLQLSVNSAHLIWGFAKPKTECSQLLRRNFWCLWSWAAVYPRSYFWSKFSSTSQSLRNFCEECSLKSSPVRRTEVWLRERNKQIKDKRTLKKKKGLSPLLLASFQSSLLNNSHIANKEKWFLTGTWWAPGYPNCVAV